MTELIYPADSNTTNVVLVKLKLTGERKTLTTFITLAVTRKMKSLGLMGILGSVLSTNSSKNLSKPLASNQITVSNKMGTSDSRILREEVINAQKAWGDAIVAIGKAYRNGADYRALAADIIDMLYGYDEGTVLFKPTKAAEEEFRLTKEGAISYFVQGIFPEDRGFALQPWSKVRFENTGVIVNYDYALAMGDYYFKHGNTGKEVKVDFTFGYHKNTDGRLRIDLHHSYCDRLVDEF